MRRQMKNAFGSPPETFSKGIEKTLCQLEAGKPARLLLRTVLPMALTLVIVGCAFAAGPLGLTDFFERMMGDGYDRKAGEAIVSPATTDSGQPVQAEAGGVRMSVTNAAHDGQNVYLVLHLAPLTEEGFWLERTSPQEGEENASGKKAVIITASSLGKMMSIMDMMEHPDGTVDLFLSVAMPGISSGVEIVSVMRTRDESGGISTGSIRTAVQPLAADEVLRHTLDAPVEIPDTPVTITKGEMVRTPFSVSYQLEYNIDHSKPYGKVFTEPDPWFNIRWSALRLLKLDGEAYPLGTAPATIKRADVGHVTTAGVTYYPNVYLQTGTIRADTLPETLDVRLEVKGDNGSIMTDAVTLDFLPAQK